MSPVTFVTLIEDLLSLSRARLSIASLRAFGGPLAAAPVRVFFVIPSPDTAPLDALGGVSCLPLAEEERRAYTFSAKVHACAQAEALAAHGTLVWFDPGVLFIQPPLLLDLSRAEPAAVALRPVHHRNVGSPADEPLDLFWRGVFRAVGMEDTPLVVESFADGQRLRPYYNTHAFALDPALGLCRAWLAAFNALVDDAAFQSATCFDALHRIFLHQAVLSALVARDLAPERARLLPPAYNYPLNLHACLAPGLQVPSLEDLVTAVYEEAEDLNVVQAAEPLRSWLADRRPEG